LPAEKKCRSRRHVLLNKHPTDRNGVKQATPIGALFFISNHILSSHSAFSIPKNIIHKNYTSIPSFSSQCKRYDILRNISRILESRSLWLHISDTSDLFWTFDLDCTAWWNPFKRLQRACHQRNPEISRI